MSLSKSYSLVHPNSVSALVASPSNNSTSHGLKYFSSILTNILPDDLSRPTSFTPSPFHTISLPTFAKLLSMKSLTKNKN